jgi:hypothetical protein
MWICLHRCTRIGEIYESLHVHGTHLSTSQSLPPGADCSPSGK